MRWCCCGVLKSGTFGVFLHLSPNFSNCTVQVYHTMIGAPKETACSGPANPPKPQRRFMPENAINYLTLSNEDACIILV